LRRKYRKVKTFCCFIGYSRSGHTLVGSLLDAHPDIIISTESDAFKLISEGYRKDALYFYLDYWAKFVSKILGNKWTGYSYKVDNGIQGTKKFPIVIGDKEGNSSLNRIANDFNLTKRLASTVKVPVKYIHITRNPFDIISTMHNRNKNVANVTDSKTFVENGIVDEEVLLRKINGFFRKVDKMEKLIKSNSLDIITIKHEDIVSDSHKNLGQLVEFLGIKPTIEYLDSCAELVFKKPHKSRESFVWPDEYKDLVKEKINQYSFLKDYSFDN
jgi:hypothetical protein